MSEVRVLFVEDEAPFRRFAGAYLEEHGVTVLHAGTARAALAAFERERPDVVLLDLNLPDQHGLEVLKRLRRTDDGVRIIVLTSLGDAPTAVRALKGGATDYLTKPIKLADLLRVVREAAQTDPVGAPRAAGPKRVVDAQPTRPTLQEELLWGEDPAWLAVLDRLDAIVSSGVPILFVTGASGTGKSALARTFHVTGVRSAGPFVEVHCPSVPDALFAAELFGTHDPPKPGRVDQAAGGTLFLDEVSELPSALQPQLARLLSTGRFRRVGGTKELKVDLHLVCTAPNSLSQAGFRGDLLAELKTYSLMLPRLRERGDDVIRLAERFLARLAASSGREAPELNDAARAALRRHPFQGNVRELRGMLERALVYHGTGSPLDPASLGLTDTGSSPPSVLLLPVDLDAALNAVEAIYLGQAMERASSQREAAELLGLDRFALARRWSRIQREGGLQACRDCLSQTPAWASELLELRPPELPADGIDLADLRLQLQQQVIEHALESTNRNRAKAATLVGMSRTSLGRRLRT